MSLSIIWQTVGWQQQSRAKHLDLQQQVSLEDLKWGDDLALSKG